MAEKKNSSSISTFINQVRKMVVISTVLPPIIYNSSFMRRHGCLLIGIRKKTNQISIDVIIYKSRTLPHSFIKNFQLLAINQIRYLSQFFTPTQRQKEFHIKQILPIDGNGFAKFTCDHTKFVYERFYILLQLSYTFCVLCLSFC